MITSAADAVSTTGKTSYTVIFFLSLLFSFSMNNVLSQVRSLQIITHVMLAQLVYPPSVVMFFSRLLSFVTFDVIPSTLIYELLFGWTNVPYSDQADEIGYGSLFIIENSGSGTIFIVLILINQIIYMYLYKKLTLGGKFHKFITRQRNSFLWAGFNNFFNSIYMPMSFGFCVNLTCLNDLSSITIVINHIYALLYGLTIVTGPLITAKKLLKGW